MSNLKRCPECNIDFPDSGKLNDRAKSYASDQLDKRDRLREAGHKLSGISGLIQRAFFHGYRAGKRETLEDLDLKGVKHGEVIP